MSDHKPRIFIGAPVYDKVDHTVLEDWMRFAYHLGRRMPQYDFMLGIKPKSEQFRARNEIVLGALQTGCEWLLMLDDDMLIDAFMTSQSTEDYGFLERMIAHDKDICGILYYQRGGNFDPVLMKKLEKSDGYRFLRDTEVEHKLQRVDVAGGGCLLIRTKIFDHIGQPWFNPEHKYGTDVQLCKKAAEKGYEVWADTSIEFGHIREQRTIVTSRNRKQLQIDFGVPGDVERKLVMSDIYTRLLQDASEYTGIPSDDPLWRQPGEYLQQWQTEHVTDADWYRLYASERVQRHVAYNTHDQTKRRMTEYVINLCSMVSNRKILDFGCGVGLIAFTLAEQGHQLTVCDVRGSGPLEFLKWRAAKYGIPIEFIESEDGPPELGDRKFDCVIAMDSIEHVRDWRETLKRLGASLREGAPMFSNNTIMQDHLHPEHYEDAMGRTFVQAALEAELLPYNELTLIKRGNHAQSTHSVADTVVSEDPVGQP